MKKRIPFFLLSLCFELGVHQNTALTMFPDSDPEMQGCKENTDPKESSAEKSAQVLKDENIAPDTQDHLGNQLILAVKARNHEAVECLIGNGVNPDFQNDNGTTPLIAAINQKNISMIIQLLFHGANPFLSNKHGVSPFSQARHLNQKDIIELFLIQKLNVHNTDSYQYQEKLPLADIAASSSSVTSHQPAFDIEEKSPFDTEDEKSSDVLKVKKSQAPKTHKQSAPKAQFPEIAALPYAENAYIDPVKFTGYALNEDHVRGKHKARVFKAALGYTRENAQDLIDQIYEKVLSGKTFLAERNDFGQKYTVYMEITGPNQNTVIVETVWMLRIDNPHRPWLVTCLVAK